MDRPRAGISFLTEAVLAAPGLHETYGFALVHGITSVSPISMRSGSGIALACTIAATVVP